MPASGLYRLADLSPLVLARLCPASQRNWVWQIQENRTYGDAGGYAGGYAALIFSISAYSLVTVQVPQTSNIELARVESGRSAMLTREPALNVTFAYNGPGTVGPNSA